MSHGHGVEGSLVVAEPGPEAHDSLAIIPASSSTVSLASSTTIVSSRSPRPRSLQLLTLEEAPSVGISRIISGLTQLKFRLEEVAGRADAATSEIRVIQAEMLKLQERGESFVTRAAYELMSPYAQYIQQEMISPQLFAAALVLDRSSSAIPYFDQYIMHIQNSGARRNAHAFRKPLINAYNNIKSQLDKRAREAENQPLTPERVEELRKFLLSAKILILDYYKYEDRVLSETSPDYKGAREANNKKNQETFAAVVDGYTEQVMALQESRQYVSRNINPDATRELLAQEAEEAALNKIKVDKAKEMAARLLLQKKSELSAVPVASSEATSEAIVPVLMPTRVEKFVRHFQGLLATDTVNLGKVVFLVHALQESPLSNPEKLELLKVLNIAKFAVASKAADNDLRDATGEIKTLCSSILASSANPDELVYARVSLADICNQSVLASGKEFIHSDYNLVRHKRDGSLGLNYDLILKIVTDENGVPIPLVEQRAALYADITANIAAVEKHVGEIKKLIPELKDPGQIKDCLPLLEEMPVFLGRFTDHALKQQKLLAQEKKEFSERPKPAGVTRSSDEPSLSRQLLEALSVQTPELKDRAAYTARYKAFNTTVASAAKALSDRVSTAQKTAPAPKKLLATAPTFIPSGRPPLAPVAAVNRGGEGFTERVLSSREAPASTKAGTSDEKDLILSPVAKIAKAMLDGEHEVDLPGFDKDRIRQEVDILRHFVTDKELGKPSANIARRFCAEPIKGYTHEGTLSHEGSEFYRYCVHKAQMQQESGAGAQQLWADRRTGVAIPPR